MTDTLLVHESAIRVGFFVSVLVIMVLWEISAARRPQAIGRMTRWPGNLMIVVLDTLAVRVLDAAIYFQHRVFHAVPWLWRLHRMHHADLEFDVTTALRFHPLEILLSMMIKMAVVVLLGAPVLAVVIFEVLLNATAMFNHGNVRLPLWLDRWLRLIVVTPDMHRVHHSVLKTSALNGT